MKSSFTFDVTDEFPIMDMIDALEKIGVVAEITGDGDDKTITFTRLTSSIGTTWVDPKRTE